MRKKNTSNNYQISKITSVAVQCRAYYTIVE